MLDLSRPKTLVDNHHYRTGGERAEIGSDSIHSTLEQDGNTIRGAHSFFAQPRAERSGELSDLAKRRLAIARNHGERGVLSLRLIPEKAREVRVLETHRQAGPRCPLTIATAPSGSRLRSSTALFAGSKPGVF